MTKTDSVELIDYRFKILYAFGMIFVVMGHCSGGGFSVLYEFFPPYAFHLGLFAFCSGYFYKEKAEKTPGQYILKKIKSLVIPLYLWNAVYACIVTLLSFKGFTIGAGVSVYKLFIEPIWSGHQFVYNLGGWFIIPLFMIEVFNVFFRKLFRVIQGNKKEIFIFSLYVAMGIGGIYLASIGYHTKWWLVLVRMLYFLPFYGAGILYKKVLERYDVLNNIVYFAIILCAELCIIYFYNGTPGYSQAWCNNFNDGPILPLVVGFLAIAFWLRVARVLEPAIGHSKCINLIADNTFSIMINQFMGFMLVKVIYAILYKLTPFCSDFSMELLKTDIGYCYIPKGIGQMKILYVVAGIVFPILVQQGINKVKKKGKK